MRQVARAIDMSPNGLNKVLNGGSPVTSETALRLAGHFGTDDRKSGCACRWTSTCGTRAPR
jgi:plasmid maintenance system antidote protein VapI